MTPQPDALRSAIGDARDEGDAYTTNVHALTAMPSVADDVARHRARMVIVLGDMDSASASLQRCMDTTVLAGDRAGIIYDLQMHIAMMADMQTLDSARLEVDRHVTATAALLDDMTAVLDRSACPN